MKMAFEWKNRHQDLKLQSNSVSLKRLVAVYANLLTFINCQQGMHNDILAEMCVCLHFRGVATIIRTTKFPPLQTHFIYCAISANDGPVANELLTKQFVGEGFFIIKLFY